ncbi:MAG: type IX secretion system protein PorQ [Bacteroidales bacterium]|jgi:hypothetical protein|nr:type IX secretion system protein PorQ [Bacteroidales bacterium]
MSRRKSLIIILLFVSASLFSQTGGNNIYEFLNLTHSGLISSLGGSNVSLPGTNLNTAWHNPALLNNDMDGTLALNYVNYFAGINYGMAMYSHSMKNRSSIAAGITYLNYGTFTGSDPSGVITGEFRASESALSVIYSYSPDSAFSAGINFKPVISSLERYNSLGFAFDLGISWHNRADFLSAGLVLRNIGYQLTKYAGEERGKLPFEIQAGITLKPEHAPFRFSFTLRHLEKYDLTHIYTDEDNAKNDFLDNLMRHIIVGAEIMPHKNFYISAGYNHQRRSELATGSKMAGTGFSWGFGINTSVFSIEFGRASYHLAGTSTHFSVLLKPGSVFSKMRS